MRGPYYHPLRLGRRGCCSIRVRIPYLTDIATISPISNLHIAQIGRYLTHSLSVGLVLLLLFTNTLTHFNSVHLQLTCNQQDKTLESTSFLSVLPLTHSTLVPNPFDKDWDTLTLNESNTENIRKGHQRHGHPQLATHTTTRSQSTKKWIHNPHTQIEILSEILLKDLVASEINVDLPVDSFQWTTLSLSYPTWLAVLCSHRLEALRLQPRCRHISYERNQKSRKSRLSRFSQTLRSQSGPTHRPQPNSLPMMMIAFITIKSSLVPLIEGLCAQIYFRFEISVVCSHLLLFFFVKEKTC